MIKRVGYRRLEVSPSGHVEIEHYASASSYLLSIKPIIALLASMFLCLLQRDQLARGGEVAGFETTSTPLAKLLSPDQPSPAREVAFVYRTKHIFFTCVKFPVSSL